MINGYKPPHIAVIGAGLSGAVVTNKLISAGAQVTLFDKSRGSGGRLSGCRLGDYSADLGASFLTTADAGFISWLEAQAEIQLWQPKTQNFAGQNCEPLGGFTGHPRLSALTRRLIQGATFTPQTKIAVIGTEEANPGLILSTGSPTDNFDYVVVATPSQQAAELLQPLPQLADKAKSSAAQIAWVDLIEVYPAIPGAADLICGNHPVLSQAVKDSAKPGRISETEIWQLEATPEWSEQHLEEDPVKVAQLMEDAFFDFSDCRPGIIQRRTHRWLYARHSSLNEHRGFLWDHEQKVGACGDWITGSGAAAAWHSANRLAEHIISEFTGPVTQRLCR